MDKLIQFTEIPKLTRHTFKTVFINPDYVVMVKEGRIYEEGKFHETEIITTNESITVDGNLRSVINKLK